MNQVVSHKEAHLFFCLQSHCHQPFQHHRHLQYICFQPVFATHCSTCFHSNCKTSNMTTVSFSSWKFLWRWFAYPIFATDYLRDFFRSSQGIFPRHTWKEAVIRGIFLPDLVNDNNRNIIFLVFEELHCANSYKRGWVEKSPWYLFLNM